MTSWTEQWKQVAREGANRVQDGISAFERDGGLEGLAGRLREGAQRRVERLDSGMHGLNPDYVRQLGTWYARLELPSHATADEVRTAFRDLMRRYHPDRFTHDRDSERLATELSQKLTEAYTGLLGYLEG